MKKQVIARILVILALAGLWELVSIPFRPSAEQAKLRVGGEEVVSVVPGWEVLATTSFVALSDYWKGGLGVKAVSEGGDRTYAGAALAIFRNSIDTWVRLLSGLFLGAFGGLALGLAISWSRWVRRFVALPGHIARMVPLLAMIPLFQLWFGLELIGMVLFVAYGVGVIFFVGTLNAVGNVPRLYIDYARTFGASRSRIYRTVILPCIFPELRSSIMLSLGLSWTLVLGSEYLGAQTGLGHMIVYSELFAYVDQMLVVALIFVIYAAVSYALFDRISRRLTAWLPRASAL